jgi:hypothetical protein
MPTQVLSLLSNEDGQPSYSRWLGFVAFFVLCVGFIKEAWFHPYVMGQYLEFAAAATVCYTPVFLFKLVELWRGKKDDGH